MGWQRWIGDLFHGKERTGSNGGTTKTEGFIGKIGEGFNTHYSVKTKSSGRRSAHIGTHTDRPKK